MVIKQVACAGHGSSFALSLFANQTALFYYTFWCASKRRAQGAGPPPRVCFWFMSSRWRLVQKWRESKPPCLPDLTVVLCCPLAKHLSVWYIFLWILTPSLALRALLFCPFHSFSEEDSQPTSFSVSFQLLFFFFFFSASVFCGSTQPKLQSFRYWQHSNACWICFSSSCLSPLSVKVWLYNVLTTYSLCTSPCLCLCVYIYLFFHIISIVRICIIWLVKFVIGLSIKKLSIIYCIWYRILALKKVQFREVGRKLT